MCVDGGLEPISNLHVGGRRNGFLSAAHGVARAPPLEQRSRPLGSVVVVRPALALFQIQTQTQALRLRCPCLVLTGLGRPLSRQSLG